jgi:uncharacterized protein (DUF4415 family)
MRKEYDFSKSRRAKDVPHLAKLQAESQGKSRITIMLDNDVLDNFRDKADAKGMGYQTLINQVLRDSLNTQVMDEAQIYKVIRKAIREELRDK